MAKRVSCPAEYSPTSSACSTHSFSRVPPICFQSFRELVSTALTDKWMPPSRPRSTSHQAEEVLRLLAAAGSPAPRVAARPSGCATWPGQRDTRAALGASTGGGQGETRRENSRTPQLRATARAPLRSSSPPSGPHRVRALGVHADDWGRPTRQEQQVDKPFGLFRVLPRQQRPEIAGPPSWYWHQCQRTVMAGAESV